LGRERKGISFGVGESHREWRRRGLERMERTLRHVTCACPTLYLPMMIHLERMPTMGARTPGVRGGKGERVEVVRDSERVMKMHRRKKGRNEGIEEEGKREGWREGDVDRERDKIDVEEVRNEYRGEGTEKRRERDLKDFRETESGATLFPSTILAPHSLISLHPIFPRHLLFRFLPLLSFLLSSFSSLVTLSLHLFSLFSSLI
jgi:hypothetical protein